MPGALQGAIPGVIPGAATLQQNKLTSPVVEAAKPLQERQVEKVASLVANQNSVAGA